MEVTRRILLKVEYFGLNLVGWQRQPQGPSAQGELEKALTQLAGRHIGVVAPSRTDSGVHAKAQVCSFDWPHPTPLGRLFVGINSQLPRNVAVRDLVHIPSDFKVKENRSKAYSYKIFEGRYPGVFERDTHWWLRRALDLPAMQDAAELLMGTHDFNAFRAKGCQAPNPVKTLTRFEITRRPLRDAREIRFDIEGDGFLRHMVRIMVGSLVEIGQGRRGPESLEEGLRTGKRIQLGQTAPPYGLTLEDIVYEPDPFETRALGGWETDL